jgi:hypothetical protein
VGQIAQPRPLDVSSIDPGSIATLATLLRDEEIGTLADTEEADQALLLPIVMLVSDTAEQAPRFTEVASVEPALWNAGVELALLHIQDQLAGGGIIRRRRDIGWDVVESFLRFGFGSCCAASTRHSGSTLTTRRADWVRDRRLTEPSFAHGKRDVGRRLHLPGAQAPSTLGSMHLQRLTAPPRPPRPTAPTSETRQAKHRRERWLSSPRCSSIGTRQMPRPTDLRVCKHARFGDQALHRSALTGLSLTRAVAVCAHVSAETPTRADLAEPADRRTDAPDLGRWRRGTPVASTSASVSEIRARAQRLPPRVPRSGPPLLLDAAVDSPPSPGQPLRSHPPDPRTCRCREAVRANGHDGAP